MNKIKICCNKGTSTMETEANTGKWIDHDENLQSHISSEMTGLKISSSKGTSSLWVTKIPKIVMYRPKILIQSRGTKRQEI